MGVAALFAIGLLAAPAAGSEEDRPSASGQPWEKDELLLKDADAAIEAGGILALKSRAGALETALAGGQLTYQVGDTAYILSDGAAESLIALSMSAGDKSAGAHKAIVVHNPYPRIALYLGSYYDEIGKPDEALRVLDLGLSRSAISGIEIGETRPYLLLERGESLLALKRAADALADFDEGLKTDDLDPKIHAHFDRGRGFALTELGRLDQAEAAYQASLQLEPNNPTALHELGYIQGLRKGAMPLPPGLQSVQPDDKGEPPPSH
jgi:tetratricopeptide (TPR) repeat protein